MQASTLKWDVTAKRIYERRRLCERHVGYVFSGRGCRNRATWKIGKEYVCGSHANALAIRILMGRE